MDDHTVDRRTFLSVAVAVAATGEIPRGSTGHAQQPVPEHHRHRSRQVKAPPNAADCHMHIYSTALLQPNLVTRSEPEERHGHRTIGCSKNEPHALRAVQPRNYATGQPASPRTPSRSLGRTPEALRSSIRLSRRHRAQGPQRCRHPRHRLFARRGKRGRHLGHGRATVKARQRARLARAVQR